jgi:gluconolactonase
MTRYTLIVDNLAFPEGPVALPDGDLALVEIAAGRVTRVDRKGRKSVLAQCGGGPNGAALGPDGALYVCNNGGFAWSREGGWRPIGRSPENRGGRIERIDIASGKVEALYDRAKDVALSAPNDLVFDCHGGFYFTDHGHRAGRKLDFGAVYYAKADGSHIAEVAFPLIGPNGIALSPDGQRLYVAETSSGRIWSYGVSAPGILKKADWPSPTGGDLLAGLQGYWRFDGLAVEAGGNVVAAALREGGLLVVSPAGALVERLVTDDPYTTNICFTGADYRPQ